MSTSRIAFVGLALVLNVTAANAQSATSAAPETFAHHDQLIGQGVSMDVPSTGLAAPTADAARWSEPGQGLIRNVAAFHGGSMRRAGGRGALIGTAIGSMLGATFAYSRCHRTIESCSGSFYLGAAAGALPGAAVGAVIGHHMEAGSVAYDRGGRRGGDR